MMDTFEINGRHYIDKEGSAAVLTTIKEAIFWLKEGDYRICRFSEGPGLSDKEAGGCRMFIHPDLLRTMIAEKYIHPGGSLRRRGYLVAAEVSEVFCVYDRWGYFCEVAMEEHEAAEWIERQPDYMKYSIRKVKVV